MKYEAQTKYDKANTRRYALKLNNKTDADIIKALDGKAAQTEIKRLLRLALAVERYTKGG